MIKPIDHKKRYAELDALRGFALFGILLANLYSFMGYNTYSPAEIMRLPDLDRAVLFMIDWFVEGKFYSIFSMLFGMGFALQSRRMKEGQAVFAAFWFRRMKFLLCIGLLHMLFIWNGDILTLYSLMGLLLVFFISSSTRTLLITSLLLLSFPLLMHFVVTISQDAGFWKLSSQKIAAWRNALGYGEHSLLEMRTSDNPKDVFFINIISALGRPMSYFMTGRPAQVLGMFVLGMYLIRLWRLDETKELIKKWRLFMLIGAPLSFGYAWTKLKIGTPYALDEFGMVQAIVYHISAPCFALGIAGTFFHVWKSQRKQRFMTFFVPLGRMALTNYIFQTSLAVMIFFGYGLALMRQIPFVYVPIIAICILLTQWVFSSWWLTHFRQGPLEYPWRKYAYRDF